MSYDIVIFEKQPTEVLDYSITFAKFLTGISDEIQSSSVELDTGLTLDSSTNNATEVRIWISGGEEGERYNATVTVETLGGRTFVQDIIFIISD